MATAPYINGHTIEADQETMAPVTNPANGKAFSKVFMARPEHMTRAIDAAYAVKDLWGNTGPSERELILIRAADVLESMRDEVVDLLIDEAGSTFGKAQMEVSIVGGILRSAAGASAAASWGKPCPAMFQAESRWPSAVPSELWAASPRSISR